MKSNPQENLNTIAELASDLTKAIDQLSDKAMDVLRMGHYGTRPWQHETITQREFRRRFVIPVNRLQEMATWAAERSGQDNGRPAKTVRLYLAVEVAKLYRECFGRKPGKTRDGPFDRILAVVLREADCAIGKTEDSYFFAGDRMEIINSAIAELD